MLTMPEPCDLSTIEPTAILVSGCTVQVEMACLDGTDKCLFNTGQGTGLIPAQRYECSTFTQTITTTRTGNEYLQMKHRDW